MISRIILMSVFLVASNAYSCLEHIDPIFVSLPDTRLYGLDSSSLEGVKVTAEIRVLASGAIEILEVHAIEPDGLEMNTVKRLLQRAKFVPAQVRVSGGHWSDAETVITYVFEL